MSHIEFDLNPQGYVVNWLVAGPVETPYSPPPDMPGEWSDQLGYEKALRSVCFDHAEGPPAGEIGLGEPALPDAKWDYYCFDRNWFVDVSTFYSLLTYVRLDAATGLISGKARTVSAVMWTYAAIELWLNGEKLLDAQAPVYKPIRKLAFKLPLREGENKLYIRMQNMGIRDTRSLFALQLSGAEDVSVCLPDKGGLRALSEGDEWLQGLTCRQGALRVSGAPPCQAVMELPEGEAVPVASAGDYPVPGHVGKIAVAVRVNGTVLRRNFELPEHSNPVGRPEADGGHAAVYAGLARVKGAPRGGSMAFNVYHVLARYAVGAVTADDEALLFKDLDFVESCGDCADFLVIGFVRLLGNYDVSDRLRARIKEVLLNFRYWMDEKGSDGMCFWSENHALMFFGSQMAVGAMYPDDTFLRSGRTGARQCELGAARCRNWLDDVEVNGVDEFNSASYMPVTLTALLNLVDFGPEDISRRSAALIDQLLRQLCLHVFDGSVLSPQGRVYRDVIYPYQQSVQSVLHMIDGSLYIPATGSMWNACFATTKYQFPAGLPELMRETSDMTYTSGNARIHLKKTGDYLLTSVASPRAEGDLPVWKNLCFEEDPDKGSYAYVRSLNERYHGTNVFQPGVYGYQQHLWYAALSSKCVVFVNHPGSAVDMDHMRPGYWYGNGIFPAVAQLGNRLGVVYRIPDDHPISFTHVFWPSCAFDRMDADGDWLFGARGAGYIGLWCSGGLVEHNGVLTGCEWRCYGRDTAYLCVTGCGREYGGYDAFRKACGAMRPAYDVSRGTLRAGTLELTHKFYQNATQII